MKGDSRVIELLNEYLQIELTGHKQYLLAAATFERWGLTRLRDAERAYSHEETDHAAVILHRILLLEGTPNLSDAGGVHDGHALFLGYFFGQQDGFDGGQHGFASAAASGRGLVGG